MATVLPTAPSEPKAPLAHTHSSQGPPGIENTPINVPRPLPSQQRKTGNPVHLGHPWLGRRELLCKTRAVPTITIEPVDLSGNRLTSVTDVFDLSAKRNASFRHPVTLNNP